MDERCAGNVCQVTWLTVSIVADDSKQRRILAELERKGIRRRSAEPTPTPGMAKSNGKAGA